MNRLLPSLLVAAAASSIVAGQILTLPPQPVAPGSLIQITVFNNTTTITNLPCGDPVWLQHADGSAVTHGVIMDCGFLFPPGSTATLWFNVPATGPGSSGSFALRVWGVAMRLDVGNASPGFPAIRGYPIGIGGYSFSHRVSTFTQPYDNWEVNNTGTVPHTFAAGDAIRIFTPGGSTPVATASLAGFTVPAQSSLAGPLPLAGLAPGPYTVEMAWLDPGTGSVVTARHGIHDLGDITVDLPGGHVVPNGGMLPVELIVQGLPVVPVPYAFCVGIAPGSTLLPSGFAVPLVGDAAVLASLADGIGGLLPNNVGTVPPYSSPWVAYQIVTGLGVHHPGAAFSGMIIRAAAVAHLPGSPFYNVSQGEDLLIQ
jgi:hypothetical protein